MQQTLRSFYFPDDAANAAGKAVDAASRQRKAAQRGGPSDGDDDNPVSELPSWHKLYAGALKRLYSRAGCKTQVKLAEFLNVRQSSISDAGKRQSIPSEWLLKALFLTGANPVWIMTGKGLPFLAPAQDGADFLRGALKCMWESADAGSFPAPRPLEKDAPQDAAPDPDRTLLDLLGDVLGAEHRALLLRCFSLEELLAEALRRIGGGEGRRRRPHQHN